MKLYVAYGSNLNKEQMSHRCPDAKPVYTGYLENWELIYRGSKTGAYATIRRKKDTEYLSLCGTSVKQTKEILIYMRGIQDFIINRTSM